MSDISQRIAVVQKRILEIPHGQKVLCLAVSKQQSTEHILEAHQAGIDAFGENYLQEAIPKIEALQALNLEWHYIGEIQSKKCKKIAKYFTWVESVDSLKIADKLNQCNEALKQTQFILIQVNLYNEVQKNGCSVEDLAQLLEACKQMKNLICKGLMTILPQDLAAEERLKSYKELKAMMIKYNKLLGLEMDTLSMGMSEDYSEAILAGSHIIRIGQGIFGPRSYA